MKFSFLLFFTLALSFCFSQNLVPNPSFEDYSSCPTEQCGISLATGWYSAGYTPDYFNTCASWPYGVPQNAVAYQYPAEGNAYISISTWGGGIRDYITSQLVNPLVTGVKYYVSLKVSHVDRFVYCANNNIGAFFSTTGYKLGNDSCNNIPGIITQNFAHVYSSQIITDTVNWITISGSFTADSAYQYITVGNFFNDSSTDTICWGQSNTGGIYLIDDIYVSTDSTLGITQSNLEQSVDIYPAITDNIVIAKIKIQGKASLRVYDLLGRLIINKELLSLNQNNISLSEYNAGIYVISITLNNRITTKKIIKRNE